MTRFAPRKGKGRRLPPFWRQPVEAGRVLRSRTKSTGRITAQLYPAVQTLARQLLLPLSSLPLASRPGTSQNPRRRRTGILLYPSRSIGPSTNCYRPRKNWPYVLGVFLFIAISALAFIFAGPLRKYFRRQITKRHIHKSGEGSPRYWAPSTSHLSRVSFEYPPLPPPLDSGAPSSHSGSAASGLPLQGRADVERNRPHKLMRPPTVVLDTPPPIRTLFATRVATESSKNHETWGQRMRRRCKEGLGFFGKASRLAFWRRSGSEEKGSGNVV